MRFWRTCVADPWSGGLVAAAVALFVALQGLVVGFSDASGPIHQRVVDGFVICALTGAKLAPADPGAPLPAEDSHLCCCSLAVLSPLAKLLPAALLLYAVLTVVGRTGGAARWSLRPWRRLRDAWRMAIAGPRAPPLLSA